MKNKRFLLGLLAIALVFGITAGGCDNVQIVAFERAEAVSNVSVIYTPFSTPISQPDPVDQDEISGILVSWDPSKNAVSYNVYVGIDVGKSDSMSFLATTKSSHWPNWGLSLSKTDVLSTTVDQSANMKVRFGITAEDFDGNHVASDIVWSEYITVPYYWIVILH